MLAAAEDFGGWDSGCSNHLRCNGLFYARPISSFQDESEGELDDVRIEIDSE